MDQTTTSNPQFESEAERIESFARAIDAIRREVENDLGKKDASHIQRVGSVSRNLERVGRTLLHFSFEPVTFGLGVRSPLYSPRVWNSWRSVIWPSMAAYEPLASRPSLPK